MTNDRQLASMLLDLANVQPDEPKSMQRLQKRWPELCAESALLPPIRGDFQRSVKYASLPEVAQRTGSLRELVQSLWMGGPEWAVKTLEGILLPDGERVGINWKGRTLDYKPRTGIQHALYYLLQHSDLAKVCANMECVRPFFLGKRPNERYCTDACFENAQRLGKKAWWSEHGKKWLKARQLKQRRQK
jgi:hypothetical protein